MTSAVAPVESKAQHGEGFQYGRIVLICSGHFVHDIYSAFIAPLLPLLIEKLGLSLVMAGSLPVFMQAPSLLGPVIGYLADRFTVRYLVIFAPAITATLATLIGFMPTYGAAALLLFCVGVNIMAFHAPAPAMIAHVSGDKVGRGMSFFMASGELARSVGPLLVAFGVTQWGMEGLWRLMFFGWLASAAALLAPARCLGQARPAQGPAQAHVQALRPGFRALVRRNAAAEYGGQQPGHLHGGLSGRCARLRPDTRDKRAGFV